MSKGKLQPRMLHVQGAGITLVADAYGNPAHPPVLLCHGGGQTRHAWGTAARNLAASGRHAVSLDLRGHGDSDWSPDGSYVIEDFADDILAVIGNLGGMPTLVGASLGGISSLVAIGESEVPVASALVLVDVTPRVEPEGAARIRAFMASGVHGFASLEEAADAISAYIPNRPRPKDLSGLHKNLRRRGDGRWYWHWDPRFMENPEGLDGQRGFVDHDRLAAAARRISVPTLLVRGMMSDIVSDASVREFRELVPHAEVVEVNGAGHMVAGDRNDQFNEAVIGFIERVT